MKKLNPYETRFKPQNLSGNRYGALVVVSREGRQEYGNMRPLLWLCLCDCGAYETKTSDQLQKGRAKACKLCTSTSKPKSAEKKCRIIKHRGGVKFYLGTNRQFVQRLSQSATFPCGDALKAAKKLSNEFFIPISTEAI